jgi:hypothetical protein
MRDLTDKRTLAQAAVDCDEQWQVDDGGAVGYRYVPDNTVDKAANTVDRRKAAPGARFLVSLVFGVRRGTACTRAHARA